MDEETLLKIYPDSKNSEEPCDLQFEGFFCSRITGHSGFHVAYGNQNLPFICWTMDKNQKPLLIWEKK